MHEEAEIICPYITFFLDVDYETSIERMQNRGESKEKFERNGKFTRELIEEYRELARLPEGSLYSLGKIKTVDGKKTEEEIEEILFQGFLKVYNSNPS